MSSKEIENNNRSSYLFGFNGKESDDEVSGDGNQYDYGFRIYNPRLGRFLSVDPLTKQYPWYTPYQFAGNIPIAGIDLDGLEFKIVIRELAQNNDGTFSVISARTIISDTEWKGQGIWQGQNIQINGKTVLAPEEEFEYAQTITYDSYENNIVSTDIKRELVAGWMPKPSAGYDYTQNVIPGKADADLEYLTNSGIPYDQALAILIERDKSATDNAETMQGLEALNVAGLMIGMYGTQFASKTLLQKKGSRARIDVENPAPGKRAVQMHFQNNAGEKYMWNFEEKKFYGYNSKTSKYDLDVPSLNKDLMENQDIQNAIKKGYKYLGESYE